MRSLRSPWLLAAAIASVVAIAEAAAIMHLIPGTTLIDTGALILTGFLAGLFTGLHINYRAR